MLICEIAFDPMSRGAAWLLGNRQRMHAALRSCVPDEAPHPLWRISGRTLTIVADDAFDAAPLLDQLDHAMVVSTRDYDEMIARVADGDDLVVEITASRERSGSNATTKTLGPFRRESEQIEWLNNAPTGMDLRDIVAIGDEKWTVRQASGTTIPVPTMTCVAHGTVTDADALRHALTRGLGRQRAYGCGLLMVARAPSL